MSKSRVSHVSLTVSTVKVFIETMKHINEGNLWGRRAILSKGKTGKPICLLIMKFSFSFGKW